MRVAVILAGCGVNDGSEIHEAVACLVHLTRAGADVRCFAPDKPQADVVDHARGAPADETRNVLVEAARIARGSIEPLSALQPGDMDAIVIPGGFGAAKNLCTYAAEGPACTVDPDVERVLRDARSSNIPIGLCCIAPVLAARVFGAACTVTIGHDATTASHLASMGATHEPHDVDGLCVDEANRLVTTPAYMLDAPIHEVFDGIGHMIERVLELASQPA